MIEVAEAEQDDDRQMMIIDLTDEDDNLKRQADYEIQRQRLAALEAVNAQMRREQNQAIALQTEQARKVQFDQAGKNIIKSIHKMLGKLV